MELKQSGYFLARTLSYEASHLDTDKFNASH